MRADVRWLADTQSLTLRHTDLDLTRAINQSIQRFRELVSSHSINHYLISVTKSTSAGATAPYPFQVLDLSSEVQPVTRVYSVDATVNGTIVPLTAEQFSARTDYQGMQGPPAAFASMTTYRLAIMPAPDASYPLVVWYLPQLPDLSADGDTFDGIAGYEEWVDWDVLIKLFQRDQYPQLYQTATAERDRLKADMIHALGGVNQRAVGVRRDTVGQRRANVRMRWPGSGVNFYGADGPFDFTFDGMFA
jgi:hypothetical protein